jgi:photosystem II stability/assembly factor-like uncharacterized protein
LRHSVFILAKLLIRIEAHLQIKTISAMKTVLYTIPVILLLLVSCEKDDRLTLPYENDSIRIDLVTNSAPWATDIHFFDSLKGIAATWEGSIYSTMDGGKTWEVRYESPVKDQRLYQILFTDENVGYVVGAGIILKTVDGGSNWSSIYETNRTMLSIASDKSGNLFVILNDSESQGRILRSSNSGLTWDQVDSTSFYLTKIIFKGDIGFCVGWGGNILRSNDGGTSWNLKTLASEVSAGETLIDIKFINDIGFCWAYNTGKIYQTIDNGENWLLFLENKWGKFVPVTIDNFLLFKGKYYHYAETPDAVIYQSVDSGKTWTSLVFKDVSGIGCFDFYSEYECYAIAGLDLLKIKIKP